MRALRAGETVSHFGRVRVEETKLSRTRARDLVSSDAKHNEANGEDDRDGDGHDHNISWNHGVDGPTLAEEWTEGGERLTLQPRSLVLS